MKWKTRPHQMILIHRYIFLMKAQKKKKTHFSSTKIGTKLFQKGLSTNKSSTVLKTLRQEGYEVPTPSQSGIWRGVLGKGEKIKGQITKQFFKKKLIFLDILMGNVSIILSTKLFVLRANFGKYSQKHLNVKAGPLNIFIKKLIYFQTTFNARVL